MNFLYSLEYGNGKNDTHEDIEIKETDEPKDGNSIRQNETEPEKGKKNP